MNENWELRVWSPTGAGPRIISRDASHIPRTGIRAQLTPEGDCREATFDAKGSGLGLRPLDCVQLVYGGTPLFYGEVRVGGNVRDVNGHRHVLRSLAGRFKEVLLPPGFATPQQPAHLTVRAAVRAVVDSGQLGNPGTVLLDDALMPDLGFDCRAVVDGRQQTLSALLEQIAQDGLGLGVSVRFGVQPDRRFFCRVASTGRRSLSLDELTGATQWREPVAEAPVTAVLWYIVQANDRGGKAEWVTHMSVSPEAAIYGQRVKRITWAGPVPAVTDTSAVAWINAGEKRYSVAGLSKVDPADTDYPGSERLLDGNGPISEGQVGGEVTIQVPNGEPNTAKTGIELRLRRGAGSLGLHIAYTITPVGDVAGTVSENVRVMRSATESEWKTVYSDLIGSARENGQYKPYTVNHLIYSPVTDTPAIGRIVSRDFVATA